MAHPVISLLVTILVIAGYVIILRVACRYAPNQRAVPAIAIAVLFLYLCAVGFVSLLFLYFGNNEIVVFTALCLLACAALGVVIFLCIRNRDSMNVLAVVLFVLACGFVAYATLFSRLGTEQTGIYMQPFRTLIRALEEGEVSGLRHDMLNLLLFLPLGMLIPVMNPKVFRGVAFGLLFGLVASTSIELIQFLTKLGVCDIDDIFSNTLGAGIGSMLCTAYLQIRKNWRF